MEEIQDGSKSSVTATLRSVHQSDKWLWHSSVVLLARAQRQETWGRYWVGQWIHQSDSENRGCLRAVCRDNLGMMWLEQTPEIVKKEEDHGKW